MSYKSLGNYGSAWLSQFQDNKQFLQVDLGVITKVTRIAHQGRADAGWWTKSFTLSYSNDGAKFTPYNNYKVCTQFLSRHFSFKMSAFRHFQCAAALFRNKLDSPINLDSNLCSLLVNGLLVSKETVALRRLDSETKIWFYQTS